MIRARLRLLAACLVPGIVLGALIGIAAGGIGGIAGLAFAVVGVVLCAALAPRIVARYVLPRQLRTALRRMAGDGESPPASARPVDLPLAERYAAAVNSRDWAALTALADPNLAVVHPASRQPYGRKRFMKAARMTAEAYPDLHVSVEEIVADPGSPDVAWLRVLETGRPRAGAPLRALWWERWTLGADRLTIRELALGRVVQVD